MRVERFDLSHLKHVAEWLTARNMSPELLDNLPEIGYVVLNEDTLACAAFIRRVEGDIGFIDSAVSNPSLPPSVRRDAMDLVSKTLIEYAKTRGIKQLAVLTTDFNTAKRASDFGFTLQKDVLLCAKLSVKSR